MVFAWAFILASFSDSETGRVHNTYGSRFGGSVFDDCTSTDDSDELEESEDVDSVSDPEDDDSVSESEDCTEESEDELSSVPESDIKTELLRLSFFGIIRSFASFLFFGLTPTSTKLAYTCEKCLQKRSLVLESVAFRFL